MSRVQIRGHRNAVANMWFASSCLLALEQKCYHDICTPCICTTIQAHQCRSTIASRRRIPLEILVRQPTSCVTVNTRL
jgi:hypothetical protein